MIASELSRHSNKKLREVAPPGGDALLSRRFYFPNDAVRVVHGT